MRKICFRADAGVNTGYGHFIRSLALADMLKDEFDCVFYTTEPTPYQIGEVQKVCSYVSLSEATKFENFLADLDGTEIVVLDNYFYTTDYQREIKAKGCKLVCIDDMHDKHYVADAVINHALTDKSLFDCEVYTKLCLGFDYALLRSPFLKKKSEVIRNNDIIINFGGSDPFNTTEHVVSLLLKINVPNNIVVVLGNNAYLSEDNRQRVKVLHNLNAEEMVTLFDESEKGIFCTSTVCIEALSRGLKVIAGYDVDNQVDFYKKLRDNHEIIPVGYLLKTDVNTFSNALIKERISSTSFFPTNIVDNYFRLFKTL